MAIGKVKTLPYMVAAIIVIWLFAFGGIGFLQDAFTPSAPGQPPGTGNQWTVNIDYTALATSSKTFIPSGTVNIFDSAANFAAVATGSVTINVLLGNATPGQSNQVTVSLENAQLVAAGTGAVYYLLTQTSTGCPSHSVVMTVGTGATLGCSFAFSATSTITLTDTITFNAAAFGAMTAGDRITLNYHLTAPGLDKTVSVVFNCTG